MSTNSNNGHGKLILGAVGIIADVAAVVALWQQGIRPVLVVLVAVGILAGVAALLAPNRSLKALGGVLVVISLIGGVVLFVAPDASTSQAATPNPGAGTSPPSSQPSSIAAVSTSTTTTDSSTPRPIATDTATTTAANTAGAKAAPAGDAWYSLTAYESVDSGNGFDSMNSITIGSQDFPDSLRGYYPSSNANPNDRRTWLLSGKCSRLDVWVGKDAASPKSGGTGRFFVKNGDVEITSADATASTPPQHLDVALTGVVRLTLFDTRGGSGDAYNAWGTPRVFCQAPPGKARA